MVPVECTQGTWSRVLAITLEVVLASRGISLVPDPGHAGHKIPYKADILLTLMSGIIITPPRWSQVYSGAFVVVGILCWSGLTSIVILPPNGLEFTRDFGLLGS